MATNSSQVSGIVSNFMSQRLRSKGFEYTSDHRSTVTSTSSSSSCGVSQSLSDTLLHQAEDMMSDYGDAIRDMVDRAVSHRSRNLTIDSTASSTVTSSSLDPPLDNYNAFKLMADSMISDGIQWSHILTLMVFVSELAYEQGVRHSHGVTFIASCSDWLVRYFSSDVIRQFLESNGGWEGMIAWAEEKSSGNSPRDPSAGNSSSSPSLTNGLLLGIGSAVTAAIAFLSLR